MNKTKVDDMLIEMITPKVKEIEEKFSSGKPLTQEDINTLLLKSQYNHINHLDAKLDETVASVVALENKFEAFKSEMKGEFDAFKSEIRGEFDAFKSEIQGELDVFKSEIRGEFNTKFAQLETKFEQSQIKMQEIIISTMKWYIGGTGTILVLLKLLDIFIK